jgi:hypothetical protein
MKSGPILSNVRAIGILVAIVAIVFVLVGVPWLSTHQGKSTEGREASRMVRALLAEFWAKERRWPISMYELAAVTHAELDFEWMEICEYHPWNHRRWGTLNGATLERDPDEDADGVAAFDLKLSRWDGSMPVFVSNP